MAITVQQVVSLQDSLMVFDGDKKYSHKYGSLTLNYGDLVEIAGMSINPSAIKLKIINKNIEGWIPATEFSGLGKNLNVEYLTSYDLVFNRELTFKRYQSGVDLGYYTFGAGSQISISGSSKRGDKVLLAYNDGGVEYQIDYNEICDKIFLRYITAKKYDHANSTERKVKLGLVIGVAALAGWLIFKK